MKEKILLSALIVLVSLVFMASHANAQITAVGPYYANPSWDQKLDCTTPANCPRFIVLSNWNSSAVLDRETGLVWERSPSTTLFLWSTAHTSCRASGVGGRKGWRLPTVEELMSLVDPTQTNPALPAGHPFTVQTSDYWSANTTAINSDNAYFVRFTEGLQLNQAKSVNTLRWCVRGGQGVDPQ